MTAKGKIVFTLLFLAVIGFGVWKWWDKLAPKHPNTVQTPGSTPSTTANSAASSATAQASEVVETLTETPKLPAAGEGQMRATLDLAKEMGSGISRQQDARKARGAMLFQEYKKKMGMVQPDAAASSQSTPAPTPERQKIPEQ